MKEALIATAPARPIPWADGGPFFGSAREMAAAAHRFPAELGWRHGGLARFRVLHKRFLVVTHPDYARQILVTRHDRYERSFQYQTGQTVIGRGLLTTDGEYWLKRRRQVLPAFRAECLRRVVPATAAATRDLLARWDAARRSGAPVPVVAEMQRLSLAVIGRALLSASVEAEEAALFGQAVRDSLRLARRRNTSWLNLPLAIPTRANRRLHETREILDRYLIPILEARASATRSAPGDILEALLQARDPETGEALPPQALLDEAKTLFVAGFETTATALAWTLYLLARHPEAAERWHAEVDQVLGDREEPEWEAVERLTWTHQVIRESMRLYPPVYNLGRRCVTEDDLGGYRIRRGSVVLISVYGIHRAAGWWPEPHAFCPERFAAGARWPEHAYLPFATGKHVCIGASFALTEMATALAMIGRRFRLAPADYEEVGESAQITLVPVREIRLCLTPRA
jgi:cytochrome P450